MTRVDFTFKSPNQEYRHYGANVQDPENNYYDSFDQTYADTQADFSNTVGAFRELDRADGTEDKSIFNDNNCRNNLFKALVAIDENDGRAQGSFLDNATVRENRTLQLDYLRARQSGNQADIDAFMNKLLTLDAKDGHIDGDVFKQDLSVAGVPLKNAVTKALQKSFSMTNFAQIIKSFDVKDNNNLDGSIFRNLNLLSYLDAVNKPQDENSGSVDFINSITNKGNGYVKPNLLGAYNLLSPIDQRLQEIDQEITKITSAIGIGTSPAITNNRYDTNGNYEAKPSTGNFKSPVQGGVVTSEFGMRNHPVSGGQKMHNGIDIGASAGTPIAGVDNGTVKFAGQMDGYGNVVIIDHGNGKETLYAHCQSINVKVGDKINQGQQIATVGSTGRSTGPHLHFEVKINGKAVNPRDHVAFA